MNTKDMDIITTDDLDKVINKYDDKIFQDNSFRLINGSRILTVNENL